MDQPTAEKALRELDVLIGEWTLEATGPDGLRWPGEARATFEWHESGAYVVQRATIETPEAPDSLAIIVATPRTAPTISSIRTSAASAASTR